MKLSVRKRIITGAVLLCSILWGPRAGTAWAADAPGTRKTKIVIIKGVDDETRNACEQRIVRTLERGGFGSDKAEFVSLAIGLGGKDSRDIGEKAAKLAPDLAFVIGFMQCQKMAVEALTNAGIRTVCVLEVEASVEGDLPTATITGIRSNPKNMLTSAYSFLNQIAPAKGKKAVFLTSAGFADATEKNVREALRLQGVELKDYFEYRYVEEAIPFIEKYNADPDVAWVLCGYWPYYKRDGSALDISDSPGSSYWKKPTITFWENGVGFGFLAGVVVDLVAIGDQGAAMGLRILKGESLSSIKLEDPVVKRICINVARAKAIGLAIPVQVLGAAAKIFVDYEGNYIK